MRRFLPAAVLALPIVLSACDPTVGGGSEIVTLQPRTRTATFSFPCDAAAAGQPLTVTSSQITLSGALDGWGVGDVTTARVSAVSLSLGIPSGVALSSLLRNVQVSLVGGQSVAVGSAATLSGGQTTTLTASSADVGGILRGGAFQARLDGTVVTPRATSCRIDATFTFNVSVEGF